MPPNTRSASHVAISTPNRLPNTFALNIYKLRDILSSCVQSGHDLEEAVLSLSSGLGWGELRSTGWANTFIYRAVSLALGLLLRAMRG